MAFAFLLAAALAAAGAGAPPARPAPIPRSSDCIRLPLTSHGPASEPVCGFNAVAMNEAGDRLLSATMTGRLQLWTPAGAVLAEVEGAPNHSDQIMFAGGRALYLDGRGHLVLLDSASGAEVARFAGMPTHGRLDRLLGGGLLMVSDALRGDFAVRETMIVALADGAVRARRVTGRPPAYGFGTEWAAGVTTHRDSAGAWRATLHLADAALGEVPLERWCEPIGPRPQCVARDIDGPRLHLFDLATRAWSSHDTGAPLAGTTLVEWAQAGGRVFASICEPLPIPVGEAVTGTDYACRIVDLADGRTVHRFAARHHSLVGGTGPDGRPELRLAAREPGFGHLYTVSRIAPGGRVREVGRFDDPRDFALAGPAGLLWAREPAAPGRLVARGRAGRPLARIDARFGSCATPSNRHERPCPISADRRRIAAVTERRELLWTAIEWAGDPPPNRGQ